MAMKVETGEEAIEAARAIGLRAKELDDEDKYDEVLAYVNAAEKEMDQWCRKFPGQAAQIVDAYLREIEK